MVGYIEEAVAANAQAQPQVLGVPGAVLCDNDRAIAATLQAEEDARAASQIGALGRHTVAVLADDVTIVHRQTSRRLAWLRRAIVVLFILSGACLIGYFVGIGDVLRGLQSDKDGTPQESPAFSAVSQEAFQGTNRYRSSKGVREVVWHDGIAKIAYEHAAQMASGQAPFSHAGFSQRAARFSVAYSAAGENLARCPSTGKPSECAVTGWIESPDHEQNLVNKEWTLCGIGTAQSPDEKYFFLTQLFAATSYV